MPFNQSVRISRKIRQPVEHMKAFLTLIAMFGSIIISHAQNYTVELNGLQEVPPNSSPGVGDGEFTLSGTTFSVTSGSYLDLQGNASGISVIFSLPPNTNSQVIFNLTLNSPGTTSGTFSGSEILSPVLIEFLNDDQLYVDIQSSAYPSGEIRGQIIAVPEPATMTLMGIGSLAVLALRRRTVLFPPGLCFTPAARVGYTATTGVGPPPAWHLPLHRV
jgi:CHRD domain-containing protein/PEP-CTERM motif-containing protein